MMDRVLEQKIPITLELADAGEDSLTSQQWKMVEGYVQVLKPIADFTADMGSTTQPTLSMVIRVLYEIRNCLQDFIRKPSNKGSGIIFARTLLLKVNERFPDLTYNNNKLYQLATLLDPRFKDLLMPRLFDASNVLEDECQRKARENIRRGRTAGSIITPTPGSSEQPNTSVTPTAAKKSKWGHLHKISQARANVTSTNEFDAIHTEVKNYLALPVIDASTADAVQWWDANQEAFPNLLSLAVEYLGIAATEVQSERDFSSGGNTVTPKRVCLSSEHVQQSVFLHRNLQVPNFPVPKKQSTDAEVPSE